jgi:steroid delta-isomerase-like uncharacterized protein
MSIEENKVLARRLTEEVMNKGNLAVIEELLDTNFVFHHPTGKDLHGPEEFKQLISTIRMGFPDIHFIMYDIIAEGDMVAYRWKLRGTHKNEFRGIPPTGKTVTMWGLVIDRIADGKIVELWERYDTLGLMRQLDVIPE